MYVVIDNKTYSAVRNISFAPQTDVTGSSVQINEFSVQIKTTDTIAYGQYAELYNDTNVRFAKYWIVYAEHITDEIVQIVARSDIALLENVILPAVMYNAEPITDVLDTLMVRQAGSGIVATIEYALSSSLENITITGFCPEQTARERLRWVCIVAGAYVRAFFNTKIRIAPIDNTETLIPIDKTYYRPTVTYKDYVTAVKVTGYSFTAGTPGTTDEWVSDGTNTYIVTKQTFTLTNSNVPASAPDNVIEIDGVYLVNSSNVSGIMSYLSQMYFKRAEIALDIVNNGDYKPGDKLVVYADEDSVFTGYASLMDFEFGQQAKAKTQLVAVDTKAGATLTIRYKVGSKRIAKETYVFPVGYTYTITTRYIDKTINGHRYIYRPTTSTVTGTMTSGTNTAVVQCEAALDLYKGKLHVISVDEVTVDSSGDYAIGVIA